VESNSDNHPSVLGKITDFEKNMLRLDKIDLDKEKSIKKKIKILKKYEAYAIANLYLNTRFIIYKGYLSEELKINLSDDDVFDIASPIVSQKLDYNTDITGALNLTKKDRAIMNYYEYLYTSLKSIKGDDSELHIVFPNSKSLKNRASEKTYVDNIILLKKLRQYGIDEYTSVLVHNILDENIDVSISNICHEFSSDNETKNLKRNAPLN